jgi:hypothetical protein
MMRTCFMSVLLTGILLGTASAASPSAQPPAAAAAKPSTEETLKAMRNDLQGQRADIIAKNITLNAEEASKFWPIYSKFQDEQNVIVDEQLKSVKQYVDSYQNLDDAAALAHLNGLLDGDMKMNALRRKWLEEFKKILPVRTAARVIQIDRRLSLAAQMTISAQVPLIH